MSRKIPPSWVSVRRMVLDILNIAIGSPRNRRERCHRLACHEAIPEVALFARNRESSVTKHWNERRCGDMAASFAFS